MHSHYLNRKVVAEHRVGFWHELGDVDGVAASIRALIDDPGLGKELGRNARELFEREYTLAASGRRYSEVLMMADPRPRPVASDAS